MLLDDRKDDFTFGMHLYSLCNSHTLNILLLMMVIAAIKFSL